MSSNHYFRFLCPVENSTSGAPSFIRELQLNQGSFLEKIHFFRTKFASTEGNGVSWNLKDLHRAFTPGFSMPCILHQSRSLTLFPANHLKTKG